VSLLSRSPASIFRTAAVDAYLVPRFGEEFAAHETITHSAKE
jgi:hypothetical protein